jgi:hypothetical protein
MDIDNDEIDEYDDEIETVDEDYEEELEELELEEENEEELELEEENEESSDEEFKENIKQKKIIDYKKDIKQQSRNVIKVPEQEKITDNKLHLSELSFIISTRAKEISKNYTNFATNPNLKNAIDIAYDELYSHRCPLLLRRFMGVTLKGDLIFEEWDVNKMTLPVLNSR